MNWIVCSFSRLNRSLLLLSGLFIGLSAIAGEVRFAETTTVLPTYAPGGYDKTPLFYTGRVYQGAQGRVYPYPMQDVLFDGKVDETYKYLTLENEWLQMGLLPEHGGHLLNFTDKQTGFETFYRQHVIKPALIGMLGAWISGGVEWNFPHHHRATTAMPIDWRAVANEDGSKTIWIGETELRRRLKWTIGLSLLPDRAVLQAENIFMNRQPWIESMIYWANVSVHCGDDYQILFPPSCHLGFDHHKNYWTSFPIGPRKEEVELLPSQRSKYADDISGTMDLSWWKNFTIESRSIFAMDPDNAWLAGFDHKKQCGTAHVSNRHITVGKKFFLWGNFPEAHVWDTVLTDNDGPYLELMVGCWSDNQPDYSWIAPYETRKVKQFWFPVKGIGGVKNVTVDGAVNVDRRGKEELLVGFYSTRVLKGCTVTLYRGKTPVFAEKGVALDPNTPWCKPVKVDADAADQEFTAAIADAAGKVFLSYTPVGPDPHDPLPPKVENPKEPKEYVSAELAYEIGLRLAQFHNGLIDPEPYYKRALEIDPDYTKANLAMGVRLAKNGSYAAAKPYLERAVKRATQNHTRALDASPEYYLALVERGLGNLKRAEDLFWRCTWRLTHKKESFVELARLAALKGDLAEALARIDDALRLGQDEAKLWTMKGVFLRKLGKKDEARSCFDRAIECDPLEYWGMVERDGFAAAEKNRGLKAQQLLECIADYWGIGAWNEVVSLCDAALAKATSEKPYATEGALPLRDTLAACDSYKIALFGYFKGAALEHLGNASEAKKSYGSAAAMPTDYCFPNRLEEEEALMMAAKTMPELANTWYYLGCDEWNHDRKEAALADWRKAVELNPKHALALRCIGFGLSHPGTYFTNTGVPSGIASREAYDYYLKSLGAEPHFRTLDEAGKLAEKLNLPAAERLALMEKYRSTVDKYDPCILRLAYTYNAVGEYAKAHEILTTRRFHVWEGADGLLAPFVEACLGLGKEAMARKDYTTALKFFEESTTYPANLQAGRPGDAGTEPKSRYFMAQCKKALGDEAGYRTELENSLKGWIHAGEMDYWRVKALRELGRDAECAPLIAELKQAIKELETPQPTVINAYAKFAGDNSAMERAAKAREKAGALKALLNEFEDGDLVIYDGTPLDWTDKPLVFSGPWDLSSNGTIEIELENTSTNADVRLCVDIGAGDESRCRLTMIPAGFSGTVTLDVCPYLARPEVATQITNMRTTPFMNGDRDRKYDPAHISEITLRHHWTGASTASQGRTPIVRVRRVMAKNTSKREWPAWYAMGEKDFFPFVDPYGQFRFRDWPRKVKKDADLKGAAKAEERDLDANPPPTVWDRYGGWSKGPRLEATGRFRLTKWQDKWWFVDPDGCLWWSHGVVRVSPSSAVTPLDGREKYFAGLPPDEATEPFAEFYHTNDELLKPYFDKKGWKRTYDFSAANLKRKYGDEWRGVYADLSHRRLRSWGLNTIANSSDAAIRKMNRTPWIERLETRGPRCKEQKNEGFWWPVPDPFHPEFRRYLREQLESRREELTSPWCVGIFVDNEHNWAGISENTVREYFKVVREEIKRLDPNLLYFGCRFAGSPERVVRLCAEYADALSYNPYRLRLDGLKLPQGVDKPILIGEFHFGSTVDTGLFNPSLVQMNDQSQRARAYCRYVTDALRHPQIVGTHWHQFSDQAVTGRFDGENFNVGFTDVCDSPYPEMRDALRQIGHRMYDMRAGKTPTVTFDCAYPGGNVKVMSFDEDSGIVRIAPDLRDTEGHWFHFDFTVRGASGRTLKFRFPQDGNLYLSTLGPAICKDGVHWTWLNADGKRHEPANAFDYTFGKTDHIVRFALSLPYVQKDWEAFTAKWRTSPEVKFDVLCKSQSGRRDVELLRVPARGQADWLFVFTARHHACETTGDPPMEGVLAELMSDSSESHWAREHADFLFVPFMDKDGVEDGDQGKNRRPWDYNRDYAKGRYSAVRAIKDLIVRESAGKKIVFFDFHSPYVRALKWDPEQEHVFTFGTIHKELAENWERFRVNWKAAQAGGKLTYDGLYDIPAKKGYWNVMKKAWDSGLLASDPWVRTLPNAKLATCCEFGYSLCGGVNSRESMRELGANLLKAAVRTVAGPILHPIFRDGVVFAEGKPIRVYGSGTGRVEVAFDGETRTAEGGADGWLVEFPPHGKSVKPMTMEITLAGAKTLLRDIRIGEVFLMAGQSNQRVRLGDSTVSYREWTDEPNLRQYMVSGVQASCFSPTDGWFSFSAQGAADWPQLTALFGRERLAAGAGVFGAVGCHQGASVIESWLPEVIATQPRFARPKDKLHPDHFHPTYGVWNGPGVLYEKMFRSIGPFSFSGVVWYQGESNTGPGEAENYPALLKELVSTWRRDLRDPALPFLVVQIADFDSRCDADWKAVQDAQSVAAKQIPGVTLVRSADVCESADIHPRDKTRLARRLSECWDRARNSQGTSW